jgi:hypothetical protein
MLREMWTKLDAYTLSAKDRSERDVNVRNEWGGWSRRLGLPVFTGWHDHASEVDGTTRVLISDRNWPNKAGVHNQEHWVQHALDHGGEAACFMIKAVDPLAAKRKIEWLDDSRVVVGRIERSGDQAFIVAEREIAL